MITLNSPLKKLQVILAGAASTTELPIQVAYSELNSRYQETFNDVDGITTGNTAVDILTASPSGLRRKVTGMSVVNSDTAAAVVTVRLNNNSVTRNLVVVTLQTGEALYYSQHSGWYCVDVNGNQKSNSPASSGASSTANSAGVSAGLAASVAVSQLLSIDTVDDSNTSIADSKGVSAGLASSVADSKGTSAGLAASVVTSSNVVTDSKAVSDGLAASVALSTAASDGLAASVALSANVSAVLVTSTNFSKLKSSGNGTGL